MAEVKNYFIGVGQIEVDTPSETRKRIKVVSSSETKKQIEAVKALECCLEHEGESLTWDVFDNPSEPRSIFQSIVKDREKRVDKRTIVETRPPFCVVTAIDNRVVRLEFYEGYRTLTLQYDVRAKELEGESLVNFMDEDPQAKEAVVTWLRRRALKNTTS